MEATLVYLTWSEKVAPRIHQVYKQRLLKICAIFRDPVKRAYSHYWHRVRMAHASLSFADAIAQEESRLDKN